jgi:FKBP-type peptidyl-prolyl cis-trans isomerase 2
MVAVDSFFEMTESLKRLLPPATAFGDQDEEYCQVTSKFVFPSFQAQAVLTADR